MAAQNLLIMNLLRIITPEEIADIATKHNGGKFLSLTDLVNERVERKIYRDFTNINSIDLIHDEHAIHKESLKTAKILPFKTPAKKNQQLVEESSDSNSDNGNSKVVFKAITTSQISPVIMEESLVTKAQAIEQKIQHKEDENMSSFILIEKERLKHSQENLKRKEIINLYQKNSNIDLEQIKSTNQAAGDAGEAGVLVNKKQY
jgi:hypothetical protein